MDIPAGIQLALSGFLDRQEERLAAIGPELTEQVQAARDATSGGKRLRPSFCYWGFRAAGGDPALPILTAAASLEMLHVSALVHDDVMDSSDVRRGRRPLIAGSRRCSGSGPRRAATAAIRSVSGSARRSCSGICA